MRLQAKTALITGGATGIGLAIARAFAGEGCRVAIAGRREQKLREAASSWKDDPPILTHAVDVADRQSVDELVREAGREPVQRDSVYNVLHRFEAQALA